MSKRPSFVPAGWIVTPLKSICERRSEPFDPSSDHSTRPYIGLEHIVPEAHVLLGVGASHETVSLKAKFYEGDVLYGKLRPYLNKVVRAEFDGVCSTEILPIHSYVEEDGDFVYLALQGKRYLDYAESMTAGTQHPRVGWRDIARYEIAIPEDSTEKQNIAMCLRTVDRAIQATQASIDAAQKLKRGLMQNLLSGKLKPDGTWRREDEFEIDLKIGRIPKNWGVGKFKDFFVLQRGADLTDAEHKHGSVPVVKSNGIDGYHEVALVKAPGVTTGRSGTIGQVFYIEEDFWPHNTALYVKDFKGNYPRFCYYLISLMQFDKFAAGTGVPTLNRRDIHVQRICIPDEPEQKEICTILDNCDADIEWRKKKLTMLQQVKKSFMQNLLTGKVRIPPDLKIE